MLKNTVLLGVGSLVAAGLYNWATAQPFFRPWHAEDHSGTVPQNIVSVGKTDTVSGNFGACCFSAGVCTCSIPYTLASCTAAGGAYQGDGSDCSGGGGCFAGACCTDEPEACAVLCPLACAARSGRFRGSGSDCYDTCLGACEVFPGKCIRTMSFSCRTFFGGSFNGYGTECPSLGACRLARVFGHPDCCKEQETEFECAVEGGEYLGDGATCAGISCSERACPGIGDCCTSHHSFGCSNESCCESVCSENPWCCFAFGWDDVCADRAKALCSSLCPPIPFGDANKDGNVDLADFSEFQRTFTGPRGP